MPTANPIILAGPVAGLILPVEAGSGGLHGYLLLGQSGVDCAVEISVDDLETWETITYPHLLEAGQALRLTRTDPRLVTTAIHAIAPDDDGSGTGTPLITASRGVLSSDGYVAERGVIIDPTLTAERGIITGGTA